MASISLTGMPMRSMKDSFRLFAPIVHDVVETADKKKMHYQKEHVFDDEVFKLRKDYTLSENNNIRLDHGIMLKLVISTENFDSLTGLTILPFDTHLFINMKILYATDLPLNSFTDITNGTVKLKKSFSARISGQDQEIDRGRLAAFSLGLQNMTEITELDVSNV